MGDAIAVVEDEEAGLLLQVRSFPGRAAREASKERRLVKLEIRRFEKAVRADQVLEATTPVPGELEPVLARRRQRMGAFRKTLRARLAGERALEQVA